MQRIKIPFFQILSTFFEHINGLVRIFWPSGCFWQNLLVKQKKGTLPLNSAFCPKGMFLIQNGKSGHHH